MIDSFGRHNPQCTQSTMKTSFLLSHSKPLLRHNIRWRHQQVLLDHHTNHIAHITLNRPKAANAMGRHMVQDMQDCLSQLHYDTTRVVLLHSTSPTVFSAGADLKERKTMSMEEAEGFVTSLRDTFQQVASLPMPVVAAIEGVAVGGGLELALAADLRVASSSATLGLPETSLAIIPGAGGTQRLSRILGLARAKEWIWTAKRVTGQEAFDAGLVNRVVEPGRALEEAIQLATEIARNGPVAIRASKMAMDRGILADSMEEALQIERECYARVLPTKDRLEGLQAFQEGRKPEYQGT